MQWRVNCQLFPTSAPVDAVIAYMHSKKRKKGLVVAMTTSDFGSFDSWNQERREQEEGTPCFNNNKKRINNDVFLCVQEEWAERDQLDEM